mmetsp:Transcript_782/g.1180  ORF Transcript_782/g.1180 Transcript_782/m.1180 type:complete len:105 (+) Transcript_782:500-814(+)
MPKCTTSAKNVGRFNIIVFRFDSGMAATFPISLMGSSPRSLQCMVGCATFAMHLKMILLLWKPAYFWRSLHDYETTFWLGGAHFIFWRGGKVGAFLLFVLRGCG